MLENGCRVYLLTICKIFLTDNRTILSSIVLSVSILTGLSLSLSSRRLLTCRRFASAERFHVMGRFRSARLLR